MVTKKKKTRAKGTELTELGMLEKNSAQSPVNNRNRVNTGRLFENLKNHWWIVAIIVFFSIGVFAGGLKYLEADAKKQIADRANPKRQLTNNQEQSFLSQINPFLPNPTPTPQLTKEYIYAGNRLLAVEDAGANAAPPADLAVWRPASGTWYVMGSSGTLQASQQWGAEGDLPVPGDYDGDGKTDFCVFRPTDNKWYVLKSSNNSYYEVTFGIDEDKPVPADYDGDGKTDIAVYRGDANGNGTWYSTKSSDPNNYLIQQFGLWSDVPTPKDFDGDGKSDFTVWRDGDAMFYALTTSNGQLQSIEIGSTDSQPVPADYDGDGKADAAVWDDNHNQWRIRQSSDGQIVEIEFGDQATDLPAQNDYDGDGKVDIAVWRANSNERREIGNWYIRNSSSGQIRTEHWGQASDIPVPVFWRR